MTAHKSLWGEVWTACCDEDRRKKIVGVTLNPPLCAYQATIVVTWAGINATVPEREKVAQQILERCIAMHALEQAGKDEQQEG